MSKFHRKWRFTLCVLILTLWQRPSCAQNSNEPTDPQTITRDPSTAAMARELAAMKKRIEELETQLQKTNAPGQPAVGLITSVPATAAVSRQPDTPDQKPAAEPFAFADFTWLTGNPRTKESPLDTKI